MQENERSSEEVRQESRREFISKCGRFGLTAPPALMILLSTAKRDYAVAGSYGGNPGKSWKPGKGLGDKNHDHWGPPGKYWKGPGKHG
jgi:hypothetical protein